MSILPDNPAEVLAQPLVVAISSRALFDLEQSHQLFTEQGLEAYCQYQIDHENEPLQPGVAFSMVTKLLNFNAALPEHAQVEVILLSRNSADTGLRVFNSIAHYGLDISRAAFTNGEAPYPYVAPFGADLFLSSEPDDVRAALEQGVAAATIVPSSAQTGDDDVLRIAFDGDAVIFSDEAERIYQQAGLMAFQDAEKAAANTPLLGGPFKNFLAALHRIQRFFPVENPPLRTALVTARAAPAHERVIRTLRAWNIRIDEAFFLGGMPKGPFLRSFGADIFFDDQRRHCDSAVEEQIAAGHVPTGVTNGIISNGVVPLKIV